jgi:hypothetical protein
MASLIVTGAACGRESTVPSDAAGTAPSSIEALIVPAGARPGDTLTVRLFAKGDRAPMALQGSIHFDERTLRYLGQPATAHLVMVESEPERGRLRWLALKPGGLPERAAMLAFEVLEPLTALPSVVLEEAIEQEARPAARVEMTSRAADQAEPSGPLARYTADDWIGMLGFVSEPARFKHVAGDGFMYGDANLNGQVTGADYVVISNVAVGNLPLLTLASRDFAIAANVTPANLPGLGEAGDPNPPGRNADGSFTITASDASVVANAAIGLPTSVVGHVIPGRGVPSARVVLSDTIAADRLLSRDTVYELRGQVVVGNPEVADVSLTIEAGTRIEGDPETRAQLIIRRGANLIAEGTRLQPIVFTCKDATLSGGCWGGLVINGFGVLNNGNTGGGDGVGFPNKEGLGGSGRYGGNLPEDSSGVLRYVRVERAGAFPATGATRLPALQLLGVGSRTVIDSVQVISAAGDGIFISGGTARLKATVVSAAGRDGLSWEDGWQGAAQFVAIQQGEGSRHAIRGANVAGQPDALPRSAPVLSHITVVGPLAAVVGSRALLFEHGSAGIFTNGIIARAGEAGLDVQGAASCALLGSGIQVRASILFNAPGSDAANDADCADEEGEIELAARANRRIDPLLLAPFSTLTPDWRPASTSPSVSGAEALPQPSYPPTFFVATPGFIGAVAPANLLGTNVPWYAGWTRTF